MGRSEREREIELPDKLKEGMQNKSSEKRAVKKLRKSKNFRISFSYKNVFALKWDNVSPWKLSLSYLKLFMFSLFIKSTYLLITRDKINSPRSELG